MCPFLKIEKKWKSLHPNAQQGDWVLWSVILFAECEIGVCSVGRLGVMGCEIVLRSVRLGGGWYDQWWDWVFCGVRLFCEAWDWGVCDCAVWWDWVYSMNCEIGGTVCAVWVLVLHGNYYFSHNNLNNPTLF